MGKREWGMGKREWGMGIMINGKIYGGTYLSLDYAEASVITPIQT